MYLYAKYPPHLTLSVKSAEYLNNGITNAEYRQTFRSATQISS